MNYDALNLNKFWEIWVNRIGEGVMPPLWDTVVVGCPVLGSMPAVFDFEDKGEFELPRK